MKNYSATRAALPARFDMLNSFMLIIRQPQMQAFGEALRRGIRREAIRHCRTNHVERFEQLGDDQAIKTIDDGIARARAYGFEDQEDLLGYLDLVFTDGPNFDQKPGAAEVLSDWHYLPAARLEFLKHLTDEDEPEESGADAEGVEYTDRDEPEEGPLEPLPALEPPDEECLEVPSRRIVERDFSGE